MKLKITVKNDEYKTRRGGYSKVLEVHCARCSNLVLIYQKDGTGPLERCYLDRIFYPQKYARLQNSKTIQHAWDMPNLTCSKCRASIGKPMRYMNHRENRLAFKLFADSFTIKEHGKPKKIKKRVKKVEHQVKHRAKQIAPQITKPIPEPVPTLEEQEIEKKQPEIIKPVYQDDVRKYYEEDIVEDYNGEEDRLS